MTKTVESRWSWKVNHRLYGVFLVPSIKSRKGGSTQWISCFFPSNNNNIRRANGALSKIRHYIFLDILPSIYHAFFGSHLRYGCQLWGQHENTVSRRAFILQKCALRLISFSPPRTNSAPLFSRFEILSSFDHVKLSNILFIHKLLSSDLPNDICNTFSFKKIDHDF